jgi:hypothetical protein
VILSSSNAGLHIRQRQHEVVRVISLEPRQIFRETTWHSSVSRIDYADILVSNESCIHLVQQTCHMVHLVAFVQAAFDFTRDEFKACEYEWLA